MASRRGFMKNLGALAALPFLKGSLATAQRKAEGEPPPTRFVMLFTGNGQMREHWLPMGAGRDFQVQGVLEPLSAHRDKLLLVHGLKGADTHSGGMTETTTGKPPADLSGIPTGGPSIDQYFAELWRGQTPLPSLELGVWPSNRAIDQVSYSLRGFGMPPIASAYGAFDRVFAASSEDPAKLALRRKLEQSMLDQVAGEIGSLSRSLDSDSRRLLDEHLSLLRERERELQIPSTPLSCELHPKLAQLPESVAEVWPAQTDNIVSALRCGTTRVASLRCGGWGGIEAGGGYQHLGVDGSHHGVSHGTAADSESALYAINRWHAEMLADLCSKLDAIPEGEGSLLDYTVVVWFNELGLGPLNNHGRADVPVVLAGGSKVGLANGLLVNFAGQAYQDFLFSLAYGLGSDELERFGDHGSVLLEELFT